MAKFINTESHTDIHGIEIHQVVVHSFNLGDVDDPALYAAQPLYDWEKSEVGQWVMAHSTKTPTWFCSAEYTFGHKFTIVAWLNEPDYLFFKLKFK